jgi:signal peptidase II
MILIIVIATLILDQLTKFLAVNLLSTGQPIAIIRNYFQLTLLYNSGAAFGILKNQVPFFIITSILAIVLIIFSLRDKNQPKIYFVSLSLILAGALGNFTDRIRIGAVIDFLDFRIWPVFNIADSAITVGAVLLGWAIIFAKRKGSNNVS